MMTAGVIRAMRPIPVTLLRRLVGRLACFRRWVLMTLLCVENENKSGATAAKKATALLLKDGNNVVPIDTIIGANLRPAVTNRSIFVIV